jgi:deoxyribonuclease V
MRWTIFHGWDLPVEEARAVQARLAGQVIDRSTFASTAVRTVAGVDVGFRGDQARAAAVVLSFPDLKPLDCAVAEAPVSFPYIPGLLAFREAPAVLAALERLSTWPDVLLFDAQGVAHPRRLGLAAHLGVLLDSPSIGCAKSRLVGRHTEPGEAAGSWTPLCNGEEVIGAAVRTRAGQKPMYVSIGHRVDLQTAIELVLACVRGHRLPETTRYAHRLAGGGTLPCGVEAAGDGPATG